MTPFALVSLVYIYIDTQQLLNQDLHFADFRRTVAAPAGAAAAAAFCSKAAGHRILWGVGAFPHPNHLRTPPPPSPQ
jgi:hypothetical protein